VEREGRLLAASSSFDARWSEEGSDANSNLDSVVSDGAGVALATRPTRASADVVTIASIAKRSYGAGHRRDPDVAKDGMNFLCS